MIRRPQKIPQKARPPHVEVVVPCYNYGAFLGDCVSSVVRQQGVSTTVHILDDASTDASAETAQVLADRYPNVRLTVHARNIGHIETYNEGLCQVDSDYVVLLSADDMLPAGALARSTSIMEHHPRVGLVYGHPQEFTDSPKAGPARVRSWSVWPGARWIELQFSRALGIISSPEAVVRTSVQHRVGYYEPGLPHSGDLEMWLRVADNADVARVNGPDQAYRRLHSGSMMATEYGTLLRDLGERKKAYDSFLKRSMLDERAKRNLRRKVYARMAAEAFEWAAEHASSADVGPSVVTEAVSLARGLNSRYETTVAYKDFLLSSNGALSGFPFSDVPMALCGRVVREFGPRLRWKRWRRYGF